MDLLALDFMRNSLIAALLVGASAPLVGVFLVQRGMSLIGDGMGDSEITIARNYAKGAAGRFAGIDALLVLTKADLRAPEDFLAAYAPLGPTWYEASANPAPNRAALAGDAVGLQALDAAAAQAGLR